MSPVTAHPSPGALQAFALGKLTDVEQVAIEEHLQGCAECQSLTANAPADDLLILLREARPIHDTVQNLGDTDGSLPALTPPKAAADATQAFAEPINEVPTRCPVVLQNHPRYQPLRLLGTGGMGTVWLVQHRLMNRQVVIKVIRQEAISRVGTVAPRAAKGAGRCGGPHDGQVASSAPSEC